MRAVGFLLGKDLRRLVRSPLLLAALLLYPLLVALLVGLVVRYAGERPQVALVDRAGLPQTIVLGNRSFDLQQLFEQASEVDLVRMSPSRAEHELDTGQVVAVLTVPEDFTVRLRGLRESPKLVLRTSTGALGSRVTEKMRALVYGVNLELQQAFIDANLGYVKLLQRGGSGRVGSSKLTVLGLRRAEKELDALARSHDPAVARPASELARFVRQVDGAVGQVGEFLRATANPVELSTTAQKGRTWVLSAQVQAYALALALAFIAVILGAAALTAEREEHTIRRLARGLVGLGSLVVEKIVFVAIVGTVVALALAIGFGLVVEVGGVSGGQPWARLPLLLPGLVLASAAFGALGVLVGALARDSGTAMLLALLVGLPVALAGVIPAGAFAFADWLGASVPFGHAVDLATAALYDSDPWGSVLRQSLWLLALVLVFGGLARVAARRLLA
jgi:ABC-2 type transport system permease protein